MRTNTLDFAKNSLFIESYKEITNLVLILLAYLKKGSEKKEVYERFIYLLKKKGLFI